jgi:serine/threonine-protein kinase HipA
MAMALRGKNPHYRLAEIQTRHWKALVKNSGTLEAWDFMLEKAQTIENAIAGVMVQLPKEYPHALAERIFAGARQQAALFLKSVN